VRGGPYGENDFVDNGDGTVTDRSTELMWVQEDSGKPMNWKEALSYAGNLAYAGYDDWRLPDAKELQYIVDYTRSPDTTDSPAIDPVFQTTSIENEAGQTDYPYFWSSTTHLDGRKPGAQAAYVAFGRAIGKMRRKVMDVHGAGAQRSDPKTGRAMFRGPQGDAVRSSNFVRCVRGGSKNLVSIEPSEDPDQYPHNITRFASSGNTAPGSSRENYGNQPRMGGFVKRLDRDGDGKVSRPEFDGPPDAFDRHDRNHDGYLTEDEASQGPPPGGGGSPRP
jgi:hypothetical protein